MAPMSHWSFAGLLEIFLQFGKGNSFAVLRNENCNSESVDSLTVVTLLFIEHCSSWLLSNRGIIEITFNEFIRLKFIEFDEL